MTVIEFTPGLVPVLKHAQHDQSDHGRRGSSGSGISVENVTSHQESGVTVYTGTTAPGTVAYRGVRGSELWGPAGAATNGVWRSLGGYNTSVEGGPGGSTMFASKPDELTDKVHRYTHIVKADIGGLPFRTLREPQGGQVNADIGLGLGITGEIPLSRIISVTGARDGRDSTDFFWRQVEEGGFPVAKHGTHDQSDHGRRGSGSPAGRALDPTNADDVREAFTGTIETRAGTVNVVVDSVEVFDFSTSVKGALIDSDGKEVGEWFRTVVPETKVMYNEVLVVSEGSRGSGIGTEFQKHSERAALALGMEKIVIKAADDGKEAWASERFGFDFAGPPSEGLYRAKMAASSPRINRPQDVKKIEELERKFEGPESGWPKPHEILAVGSGETPYKLYSEHVFYTVPPRQSLGQSILSHGWDGKKPADRVTKRVEPKMFYVTVESDYAGSGAVAKHGIHDQSSHGNWAHGKGTGSHAGEAKMGPASATDGYGNARTTTYISGNRGETQTPLPEGWFRATGQEHDDYDRAAMRAMMRPEMLEGIDKGSPLEDDYLRAYRSVAASKVQLFAGPNGTGVVVQGEISWRDDFTPEDFVQNLKQLSELQRVTPAPGLQVIVGTQEFSKHSFDESTRGFVDTRDVDTMHLRPSALSAGNKYDVEGSRRWDNLMSTSEANRPVYALTHEYGHVVDRRSNESALADFNEVVQSNRGLITGSSPYAREGYFGEGAGGRGLQVGDKPTGREMYAEAWTGWVLSKGWAARNPGMVQFFAEKYGWDSETGTAPMAKAKSKGRIYMDSFGPEGGWVLDSLPGESATVAFSPGLKPVLKHGTHDQKDHGRRGRGGGGGSQDGGVTPVVNDFTDSDGNLAQPMSLRDSDHPDEEITVIPASANPMDGLNVVSIYKGEEQAGVMRYEPYSGKVEWINVDEKFRRQGVATRLWEAGKYVAARHPNMVEPKHSQSQTTEGAAWASVVKFYRSIEANDGVAKHGSHAQLSHGNRSKGIDRTEMPQIPKANREAFLAELTDSGISHREEAVDPRDLRRTQRAIDPVNVAQMHAAMVAGTMKEGLPIIVSSDGKVLDGHHRWAAAAQLAGEVPGTTVKITRVDMKMDDLLARARKFNEEQGIAARAIGEVRPVAKHGSHDQRSHGRRYSSAVSGGLTASIADRVREYGGLSVNIFDGSEPETGFMVARGHGKGAIVTAEEFYDPEKGPEILTDFLIKYRSDLTGGAYLGLWHNKKDGNVYLDVSDQIAEQAQAEKLGGPKFRDQISIWDVVAGEEIQTGGSGKLKKGVRDGGTGVTGRSVAESLHGYGRGDQGLRERVVGQVRGSVSIGFTPGLVPVLKHEQHNQKDHGRRSGNSGEDPKAMSPELQAAFDHATGIFTTPGPEAVALANLETVAINHAVSLGMSADDVPYRDLTEVGLYGKAIIRRAYDKRDQDERFGQRSDADNEALATVMDDWRFGGEVMVKVPSDVLDDIIADRVKNQFETDTSGGLYDPDVRAVAETAAHGLHPAAPASERPIYGFVGMPGSEHPYALDQYGDVTLVLKPSAKDKTTITLGDSLNQNATPVPMNGTASIRQLSDAAGRNPFVDHGAIVAIGGRDQLEFGETFMEAQIFGGIRLEQISRIVFREGDANPDGVAMLREELEGSGVSVEII